MRCNVDGNGIRTLVIIPECPLKCKYCLNKHIVNNLPEVNEVSAKTLYQHILKDCVYYEMTDGGIVFGGGEPLLYAEYIRDFSSKLNSNINIDVQTSLNVPICKVEQLLNFVNVWHIDIKDMNDEIYKKYTGTSNKAVKENLKYLLDNIPKEKIHIRVPEIPNYNNDSDIEKSLSELKKMGFTNIETFKYIVN